MCLCVYTNVEIIFARCISVYEMANSSYVLLLNMLSYFLVGFFFKVPHGIYWGGGRRCEDTS